MMRKRMALGGPVLAAAMALAQCGPSVQDRHLPWGEYQYALSISGATYNYQDRDGDGHFHPYAYWGRVRTNTDVQNCLAYVAGTYGTGVINGTMAAACGSGQTPGVGWAVPAQATHTIVNV